jgi:hypothetical protein
MVVLWHLNPMPPIWSPGTLIMKKTFSSVTRLLNQTTRVSVDSSGMQSNGSSNYPSLSADGRFVGFASRGDNLVAVDTNLTQDSFVHDRDLNGNLHADLKITTTKKPISLVLNSDGVYTYKITNNGSDTVNEVNITHLISGGDVVNFTPNQGNCNSYATISLCQLGNLPFGGSITLQVAVKANLNPLTLHVSVSGAPVDTVPTNNSVSVSTLVTP